MKKLFASSLLLLALSNITWGAPIKIACTPAQDNVVINAAPTSATFDCDPGVGVLTNQVRLYLSLTAQDNSSAGPAMSVLATANNPFGIALSCLAVGATNGDGQTLAACNSSQWGWVNAAHTVQLLLPFQVTVDGGAGSNPLPFNASGSVAIEYEAKAEVPELGSTLMGLCGAALMLLGGMRRRA